MSTTPSSASRFAYSGGSGWDIINTATMKGITDESLAGTGFKAADLNGVRIPGSMSMEFVEGCVTARAACCRSRSSRTAISM